MKRLARLTAAIVLAAGLAVTLDAQQAGSVRGTVQDNSATPIPGAAVTLRNAATGERRQTQSNETGSFEFRDVAPGEYRVRAKAEGLSEGIAPAQVRAGEAAKVTIQLEVAPVVRQQVTVSARPLNVDPVENADAMEVDDDWFEDLPIGAGDLLSVVSTLINPAATGSEGASIVVDGVETGNLDVPPSSINKMYVNKNPYAAEFREPGQGRIEVITEHGSRNHHHRTAALTFQNSALNGRNAFATDRPLMQLGDAEAEFDGPATKRTSFLLAGEYAQRRHGIVVNALTADGRVVENVVPTKRKTRLVGKFDFRRNSNETLTAAYKFKDDLSKHRGVGGFDLPERSFQSSEREHETRITYSTYSPGFINSLRAHYQLERSRSRSDLQQTAVIVLDAFSGGGAQVSEQQEEDRAGIQDIFTVIKGVHSLRLGAEARVRWLDEMDASNFGGTFEFSDLASFAAGRPFVFRINRGDPRVAYRQNEFWYFVEDQIQLRPQLTVTAGVRHEIQSHLRDHDNFAPRIALAYAPGKGRTVIRAGAGVFYDRLPTGMLRRSFLYDGARIRQAVVLDPGFTVVPDPTGLVDFAITSVYRIGTDLRSPRLYQASIGVERHISRGNIVTLDYSFFRGLQLYRMRNVNAPDPVTGIRADPAFVNINRFESSASSRSHSLTAIYRAEVNRLFQLQVRYILSRTMSDTGGAFLLPANNFDLAGEWSRADFDRRHRALISGVLRLPLDLRLGAIGQFSSGAPYNITTGSDDNRDTVANDRPAGVRRNSGKGPGFANLDLRLARKFRFGDRRREVEMRLDAFNALNHVNFTRFIGTIKSPFFGQPNAAYPARALQLSLRLEF